MDNRGIVTGLIKVMVKKYLIVAILIGIGLYWLPLEQVRAASVGLHVGSYKTKSNAQNAVDQFQAQGHRAFSRKENVPGKGYWYRVYIGPFADELEAKALGRRLNSRGVITYYTVKPVGDRVEAGQTTASLSTGKSRQTVFSRVGRPPAEASPEEVFDQIANNRDMAPPPAKRSYDELDYNKPGSGRPSYDDSDYTRPVEETPDYDMSRPFPGPDNVVTITGTPPNEQCAGDVDMCPSESACEEEVYCPDTTSRSGWNLAFRTGIHFWPATGTFRITEPSGGIVNRWEMGQGQAASLALVPSYRINRYIAVENSFEAVLAGDQNAWYITLDPKFSYPISETLYPYIKGGPVWGYFNWSNAPGTFDSNFGWEAGLGLEMFIDNFTADFGILYRDIKFNYNAPAGVAANKDKLDLSGPIITGTIGYSF